MTEYKIPEITDTQLAERSLMVAPLVRRHEYESVGETGFRRVGLGLWRIMQPAVSMMRDRSYIWSPKWLFKVEEDSLTPAKQVRTLHKFGYHGFFKPSIAEVLAQAPDDLHEFVAYSIQGPENADDLNRELEALNAGFHVAIVTYYKRAQD